MIHKKILMFAVLMLFQVWSLFAQEEPQETAEQKTAPKKSKHLSGDVRIKSGVIIDKAESLISKSSGTVHSLDLDEIAPFIQLEGNMHLYNFRFALTLLSVIPVRTGKIEEESTDIAESKNYHTAESTIDSHYKLGGGVGYRFNAGDFEIMPTLGFLYRYRKWSADNGTSSKGDFSGTLLSFSESTWFPTVGADILYKLPSGFALRLNGSVYPYMGIKTRENRFTYDDQFYGNMKGGIGGDIFLSAEYRKPENHLAIIVSLGYEGTRSGEGTLSAGKIGYNPSFGKDDLFSMNFTSNIITVTLGAYLSL